MAERAKQTKLFFCVASMTAVLLLLLLSVLGLHVPRIPQIIKGLLGISFAASCAYLVFLLPKLCPCGGLAEPPSDAANTCNHVDYVVATCSFGSLATSRPDFHLCSINQDGVVRSTGTLVASIPPTNLSPLRSTCTCCLEDFHEDSKVAVAMCGHVFHDDCLVSWLLSRRPGARFCPTCRGPLMPSVTDAEFTL
mmetsp:Transcript_46316/g.86496  ORF Transcript_46316/g.86496 Transcript_46316/m.86496 type:complete len:194 (+) Transcript_46316:37-618(+)